MNTIDCKKIANDIYDDIKDIECENKHLYIIQAGDDESSSNYVEAKIKRLAKRGIKTTLSKFDDDVSEEQLIEEIKYANMNEDISSIIVELPLPKGINKDNVLKHIEPNKDVDGLNVDTFNVAYNNQLNYPCCAAAIITVFNNLNIAKDKNIVVAGRSKLVGQGVLTTLKANGYTINEVNSTVKNKEELFSAADVIISATGFFDITGDAQLKDDVIVIDAGTNFVDGKLAGDVNISKLNKNALVTPVPNGIGVITNALLVKHIAKK